MSVKALDRCAVYAFAGALGFMGAVSLAQEAPDDSPQARREATLNRGASTAPPLTRENQARRLDQLDAQEWAKTVSALPDGGWQYVGSVGEDQRGIIFESSHHVTRAGTIVTLWIRREWRSSQSNASGTNYRSNAAQEQIDCSRQASRVLADSYFVENNLSGESTHSYSYDEKTTAWVPAIPGSLGEYLANWVCRRYNAASVKH